MNELEKRFFLIQRERDAILLHYASGSSMRWHEIDDLSREEWRNRAEIALMLMEKD